MLLAKGWAVGLRGKVSEQTSSIALQMKVTGLHRKHQADGRDADSLHAIQSKYLPNFLWLLKGPPQTAPLLEQTLRDFLGCASSTCPPLTHHKDKASMAKAKERYNRDTTDLKEGKSG